MRRSVFDIILVSSLLSITHCFPLLTCEEYCQNLKSFKSSNEASPPAITRVKATTVTQSISNWIEDVDTVNSFLNVALGLPLGGSLKSAASKALAFAQDEPTNVKLLKATPNIDAAGLAAAGVLEDVFGDVLDQLGNVVDQPANLGVALKAVTSINVNRCKNVLPSAETLWRSAATAMNISTATWPPKANRERACVGRN